MNTSVSISKRSAVRLLLSGVVALVMFWGLLPLVYFLAWPITAIAWAVGAAIAWQAVRR